MQLSKYKTVSTISLPEGKKLVLFNPFLEFGVIDSEMSGRELFLLDKNGEILWNVDVPKGSEKQGIDGRPKDEIGLVGDDGFVNLFKEGDKYIIRSMNGMIFEVNVETGRATFQYWGR